MTQDCRDFLARNGFPISRRSDGLFDVKGIGAAMTPDAVWDVFFRLYFWPDPWPAAHRDSPAPEKFCGG